MSNSILKKAALSALEAELGQLPSEYRLSLQYKFSEDFENKMENIISENRNRYFLLFGKSFSRRTISSVCCILVTVFSLLLYFTGKVTFSTARLIWVVSLLTVTLIFKNNRNTDTYNSQYTKDFQRRFTPAFLDSSPAGTPWENLPQRDYTLPQVPAGFTLSEEFRTASKHLAVFTDACGNTVYYVRNYLKEVIDFVDADTTDITITTINGYSVVEYSRNDENHLMWENRYFQYHYHGKVSTDVLHSFAENNT